MKLQLCVLFLHLPAAALLPWDGAYTVVRGSIVPAPGFGDGIESIVLKGYSGTWSKNNATWSQDATSFCDGHGLVATATNNGAPEKSTNMLAIKITDDGYLSRTSIDVKSSLPCAYELKGAKIPSA